MSTRRRFLASSGAVAAVSLAGCLDGVSSDDEEEGQDNKEEQNGQENQEEQNGQDDQDGEEAQEWDEEQQELIEAYEQAYEYHEYALANVNRGFDFYDESEYSQAIFWFENAKESFNRGDETYGDDQSELVAEVFGDDLPRVHHDARSLLMYSGMEMDTIINWTEMVSEEGDSSPAVDWIQEFRTEQEEVRPDMPSPTEFESAVEEA